MSVKITAERTGIVQYSPGACVATRFDVLMTNFGSTFWKMEKRFSDRKSRSYEKIKSQTSPER